MNKLKFTTTFSIAILLLSLLSCRVVQNSGFVVVDSITIKNMKNSNRKFDIAYFERNKDSRRGNLIIVKSDGTKIERLLSIHRTHYIERETPPPPKLYNIIRNFHLNGNLKLEGIRLVNLRIGIWREYDEWGNLIKETNYDETLPDKFDYNQVVLFMDRRGHICIKTGRGREDFRIWFDEEEGQQVWGADIIPSERNGYTGVGYILNKNTGRVIRRNPILPGN